LKTLEELKTIKDKALLKFNKDGTHSVVVGMGTCGIAAGAKPVMNAILEEAKKRNFKDLKVSQTGCIGVCRLEPLIEVFEPNGNKTFYTNMTSEKAIEVFEKHIVHGKAVKEYSVATTDLFDKQIRIALRNCGVIDPDEIEDYIAKDGYSALGKALTKMSPKDVVEEVKKSGIKGRGGAGFPTGTKWQFAASSQNDVKYVACNADEGDPGAFMDRSILEGDPHSVIEAMAIAGYAIGANNGFIYIRAEYPIAVKRLNKAIAQAKEYGVIGKNIFGSGFNFDLGLRLGAGAFVCGEETALMTSIEGHRGEPKPRPPFPAVKGIFGKPTVLNNVETYANIPVIISDGADKFNQIGLKNSAGTKVFAVGGKINNTGLVEVPIGTTIREIIYDIGGGIPNNKAFKAVQTGGPSGGCIPTEKLDTPIDYDTLKEIGSMMGSGGFIVMDEDNCMVDTAKFFLNFMVDESCGKCPPCRIGTKRMYEILERITSGKGEMIDIENLEILAESIHTSALCALGQTAANPVLSTLRYFRDEYEAHVKEKRCPVGVCKALRGISIDAAKCKGCTACVKICPVNAISGEKKAAHKIDSAQCIKCGECVTKCPFKAISHN